MNPTSIHRRATWSATAALVTALTALWSAAAGAQEATDRAQALYENHCQFCHADWAYTHEGRKVTTLKDLRLRVDGWSAHAGLHWSAEEIDAVTRYLDERFYHLTQ